MKDLMKLKVILYNLILDPGERGMVLDLLTLTTNWSAPSSGKLWLHVLELLDLSQGVSASILLDTWIESSSLAK